MLGKRFAYEWGAPPKAEILEKFYKYIFDNSEGSQNDFILAMEDCSGGSCFADWVYTGEFKEGFRVFEFEKEPPLDQGAAENKTVLGMNVIVSDVLEAGQVMMVSQSGIDKAVEKLDLRTVPVNLKYPQSAYHILEALVFGVGADNVKSALKEITQRDE